MSRTELDSSSTKKRRRAVVTWRDLPEFCDAAASVSASTFGARRLPELRALYRQAYPDPIDRSVRLENTLASGGCKTSSRHLRRRATSYASRKRHRQPEGSKEAADGLDCGGTLSVAATPSRRKRRKTGALRQAHESWKDQGAAITNESSSLPPIHWIPNHVWHAKRFTMEALWGWKVPIVHCNRGSKASLRLVREGKCLVQDVTWTSQPICLSFSRSQQGRVEAALRRIIPDFSVCEVEEAKMNEGLVFQPDCLPLSAFGPVQYAVVEAPLFRTAPSSTHDATDLRFHVHVWTHVSIRSSVKKCLEQVTSQLATLETVPGGVSRIQCRGRDVVSTLRRTGASLSWSASILNAAFLADGFISAENHGKLNRLIISDDARRIDPTQPSLEHSVWCAVQCPRDPDFPCNYGCTGMDVFCPPSLAPQLWHALVTSGGACPIGLVEACHVALEASPPLPAFPRDFPDTRAGVDYWTGASSEWKLYRSCLEAGSGRITLEPTKRQASIDWSYLVSTTPPSGELDRSASAIIRGTYGQPFLQLFQWTSPQSDPSLSPVRKRHRRKSAPSDRLITLPPQPNYIQASHESTCHSLLQSLSLPAMILCHIVLGKGTLAPGMVVLDRLERQPLGRITAGAFSHCRGSFHGLAVCGAARLLQSMAAAHRGSFVLGRCPDGTRQCRLAVLVGSHTTSNLGSLSLLF